MRPDDNISKENPFRVPEGYFESLADRTMAAIRNEKTGMENGREKERHLTGQTSLEADDRPAGTGRIVNLRPFIALAAAILGFAIIATVMVRLVNSGKTETGYQAGSSLYADLAFEEVDTYLLERELSLTEPEAEEVKSDEISTEAIIDYLMSEDIDLNDIYELL